MDEARAQSTALEEGASEENHSTSAQCIREKSSKAQDLNSVTESECGCLNGRRDIGRAWARCPWVGALLEPSESESDKEAVKADTSKRCTTKMAASSAWSSMGGDGEDPRTGVTRVQYNMRNNLVGSEPRTLSRQRTKDEGYNYRDNLRVDCHGCYRDCSAAST